MASLSPDTQNFNRLLVSIAIAIAIALVAPWFSIARPRTAERAPAWSPGIVAICNLILKGQGPDSANKLGVRT